MRVRFTSFRLTALGPVAAIALAAGVLVAGCADPDRPRAGGTAGERAGEAGTDTGANQGVLARAPGGALYTPGCANVTPSPAMSIFGTPQPENQERLSAVAQRVDQGAPRRFAAVYAGVELQSERDRILVRRKPSPDFDAWIAGEFAAECVEVVDAPYSMVELSARQAQVEKDMDYWRRNGVQINTVGSLPDKGVVRVGTLDVDRARQLMPARYGQGVPIEIVREEAVTLLPGR